MIKNSRVNPLLSFLVSMIIHIGGFLIIAFALNSVGSKGRINPNNSYISINSTSSNLDIKKNKIDAGKTEVNKNQSLKKIKAVTSTNKPEPVAYSFSKLPVDTTELDQVYKEPTLNVSIKYPQNWTYIDQDLSDKLDGVTFWATQGIYSPPPYIHLEVKDKELFSSARYKYKIEASNYTLYYNDPEELENQVMQTVYIRTGSDEDFSVKLIMEGRTAFNSFQPVFFGMIKSFKFGKSLF